MVKHCTYLMNIIHRQKKLNSCCAVRTIENFQDQSPELIERIENFSSSWFQVERVLFTSTMEQRSNFWIILHNPKCFMKVQITKAKSSANHIDTNRCMRQERCEKRSKPRLLKAVILPLIVWHTFKSNGFKQKMKINKTEKAPKSRFDEGHQIVRIRAIPIFFCSHKIIMNCSIHSRKAKRYRDTFTVQRRKSYKAKKKKLLFFAYVARKDSIVIIEKPKK